MLREKKDKWDFYQNTKGEWLWKRTAPNGRSLGTSAKGFMTKEMCIENARKFGYIG